MSSFEGEDLALELPSLSYTALSALDISVGFDICILPLEKCVMREPRKWVGGPRFLTL